MSDAPSTPAPTESARPGISASELDVMEVLWAESPLAASTVAARLEGRRNWSPQTVKTLLARLVDKGALSATRDGRRYLYAPLVARKTHARGAVRGLAERLFGGRAAPLVAHLADADGLSPEDLDELEALVAKLRAQSQ